MTSPAGLRFGRLPNDPSRPRVRLRLIGAPARYAPPDSVDLYSQVPTESWGMDGNDAVGDCTLAEVDHTTKATEVAAGNPEVQSTADEVLAAYSAITGYDPDDPSTDRGAEMQVVRAWWRKRGVTLGGQPHKVALFAELDHRNLDLIRWAVAQFGPVGLGIDCPESALDQFNAGRSWTVVPGSPSAGGHAISMVGYDPERVWAVTWGRVQAMTWDFFTAYVEEAWTQLSTEWVSNATGTDPLAGTLHDLGEQFHQVTGQPNPFPAPTPPPGAASFQVELDPAVADKVVARAERAGVSPAVWIAHRVEQYVHASAAAAVESGGDL